MLMSSNILLVLLRLDIAEGVKLYLFTISLLGATIQDDSIEERSNVNLMSYRLYYNSTSQTLLLNL